MNYFTAVRRSTSVGRSGRKRERQRNATTDRPPRTSSLQDTAELAGSKSPRPHERGWSPGGSPGPNRPVSTPHAAVGHGHKQLLYRSCSSEGRIGSPSHQLPHADPFLEKADLEDLEGDETQVFVKFFRFHKCYDLIPTSAKLVVFDTELQVKKAFYALVYNGVRAAPLWDSSRQEFVGMLCITDFIRILQMYYKSADMEIEELEEHKLDTWREQLKHEFRPLMSIGPEASLFEAIRRLIRYRIHRLPVIDPATGDVLYIVTHKRIFRFLCLYLNELPRPSSLDKTLRELKIGTLENVATATEDMPIIQALRLFLDRRVSALPIVDVDNKLKDIYAKFDVINLAAMKTYTNLEVSLKQANEHRTEYFEGVLNCNLDETLGTVMARIAKAEVHRLVVVDEEGRVVGVISLSDILKFLVLEPAGSEEEGMGIRCSVDSSCRSDARCSESTQQRCSVRKGNLDFESVSEMVSGEDLTTEELPQSEAFRKARTQSEPLYGNNGLLTGSGKLHHPPVSNKDSGIECEAQSAPVAASE